MLAPYCAIWSVGRAALNQVGVDQGSASKDSDAGFRLTKTLKVALSWTLLLASARSDSQLGVPVSRDLPAFGRRIWRPYACSQVSGETRRPTRVSRTASACGVDFIFRSASSSMSTMARTWSGESRAALRMERCTA